MTTLTFSPALDRIAAVQLGLTISSPIAETIKKVYRVPPKQSDVLADQPCFINTFDLPDVRFGVNGQRHRTYTVGMQLLVDDVDNDRGREIALAFLESLIVAFQDDLTLAGTASSIALRGGSPTLAVLEWGGRAYVGLQLFMDVYIYDTGVAGP